MKGSPHIQVDPPAADVFDCLADIRNERTGNPWLISIEKLTDGPIGAGTTFRGSYSGIGELTTELLDWRLSRSALAATTSMPAPLLACRGIRRIA